MNRFPFLILLVLSFFSQNIFANELPFYTLSLEKYNQDINHWIKPSDPDYNKRLISVEDQKKYCAKFYRHYYDSSDKGKSPWSKAHTEKTLGKLLPERLDKKRILASYDNSTKKDPDKIGYTAGFRPYPQKWIKEIISNINLKQFAKPIKYQTRNRAIAIKNLNARALPTNDPYFKTFKSDGSMHSFDHLQDAAIWVGTPLYIIGYTFDQQWFLVLTPHFIAWVESDGVGKTSNVFIDKWQRYARKKMVAITRTNTSVIDSKEKYRFNTYVGAIFPGARVFKNTFSILVPYVDRYQNAKITTATLSKKRAALMPLKATPSNFAKIISTLLNRPYGWGSRYFYNDCSSEIQNLYTPFGIWLPRNSGQQAKMGIMVDKSNLDTRERLKYLIQNGKNLTTLIYFPGHIMLYIGAYPDQNSTTKEQFALSYQNLWALRPKDRGYRAMIGQSLLFPLLTTYNEDKNLTALIGREKFQLIHLDKFHY